MSNFVVIICTHFVPEIAVNVIRYYFKATLMRQRKGTSKVQILSSQFVFGLYIQNFLHYALPTKSGILLEICSLTNIAEVVGEEK